MIKDLFKEIENTFNKRTKETRKLLGYYKHIDILNETYRHLDNNIFIAESYGSKINDYDGNEYIDLAMGSGTHLLGHKPLEYTQKNKGTLYSVPNIYAYEVGGLLNKINPNLNNFVFCNSGAEATMRALRIGRAYTGKSKIGIFSGGWHGAHDLVLVEDDYSNVDTPNHILSSLGTPKEILDLSIMLPYNNTKAFDLITKNKNDLAMVIIEPIQSSNPQENIKEFLKELREVTSKNNILFCFDEMITGFRLALGGGQEYFDINADIVTYGKILGGGYPVGVVAGNNKIMHIIKETPKIFMGGTFSANPFVMKKSCDILGYIYGNKEKIYSSLNMFSDMVKNLINFTCEYKNIPTRMVGVGSILRLLFTNKIVKCKRDRVLNEVDMETQKYFHMELQNRGVFSGYNGLSFLSTAHTKEDICEIVKCYTETLSLFKDVFDEFKK